jgi:S-DNA-T family DNA segregation ATPase FtsK/SpoIIIE
MAAPTRSKRKPATRRKPTKRTPPPPPPRRDLRAAAAVQLGGHRADAVAIGLVALAAVGALGIYSDLAGPVGRAMATATGALIGRARYGLPIVFVALAVLAIWARPSGRATLAKPKRGQVASAPESGYDATDLRREPQPIRVGVGIALLLIAAVGLLHLQEGHPGISSSLDVLKEAGGYGGAVVGGALRALLGPVGAVIVLACIALLGALLAPGVPLRVVLRGIARVAAWVFALLRHLFEVDHGAAAEDDESYADLSDASVPRGRRRSVIDLRAGEGAELDLIDPPAAVALFDQGPDVIEPAPVRAAIEVEDDDVDVDVEADEADADDLAERHVPIVSASMKKPRPVRSGAPASTEQLAIDLPGYEPGVWKLPARDVLKRSTAKELDTRIVEEGGRTLESTMHEFGVDARLVGMTVGPTVTRYELELGAGVKVNKVTNLSHDIAYAMASADVRILAPIPGRSAIGVEVPNRQRQLVTLGDILASEEAVTATHPLEVGLGRDIAGHALMANMAKMPHLLIAGATGAGKSSCINSIITSILMRATPDQVRMILVDPKRVELGAYNDLPHLLTPVVTNPKKAANALDWAVREMEMRYDMLAEVGVRDITGYNAMYDRGDLPSRTDPDPESGKYYERLPFILIVIDELADLMMVAARDVEQSVCRIAQMARAVGIHLVIATQRPSVDVITGVIKANVPSRFAFSVSSLTDSRVILDQPGAEKLVGQGDMLMLTANSSRAQRIQCSWVDEECVRKVAAHWRRQVTELRYVEGIADDAAANGGPGGGGVEDDDDDLLPQAMELVVRSGMGSTSMLQRKLRVGFSRAGRLMDLLERRGIVGPSEGSKARSVLMTVDEFEALSVGSS